jgi:hypothetical protein
VEAALDTVDDRLEADANTVESRRTALADAESALETEVARVD